MKLKEMVKSDKIKVAQGGNRRERCCSNLLLIPRVRSYPPIGSPENVPKKMGALHKKAWAQREEGRITGESDCIEASDTYPGNSHTGEHKGDTPQLWRKVYGVLLL
jgi:hypothetical protein